jgi:orotate phosphoribosyltransferase
MKPLFETDTERRGARARLRDLIREHSLFFGRFQLASGAASHFYLDLRRTTTHPEGAYLVAQLLLDRFRDDWPDGVGGPSLGADPIVGALAALSHLHGRPLPAFIVRSSVKDHGTQRQIEGHLVPRRRVALLDDVMTRGGSLIRAAQAVRAHGATVSRVYTILDRLSGGAEALAREGLEHDSVFVLTEILKPEELASPASESGNR